QADPFGRFGQGGGEGFLLALNSRFEGRVIVEGGSVDAVARDFEIDRPLVTDARFEAAVDFPKRGQWVVECGSGNRDLFKDLFLCAEVPDLVMQQWIVGPFG